MESLSEGAHTFVSTYIHFVLTYAFSHDSSVPGHGVSPQGLLKETQGFILEGARRGLEDKCSLLEMFLIKSSPTFRSSPDPRGMNSNKANSLAEEAAKTSRLRGGQALAWLDPAALVSGAQTEPSTQTLPASNSSILSSCFGILAGINGWSLDWAVVVTGEDFPRRHKGEKRNATITSQLRVTAVPTQHNTFRNAEKYLRQNLRGWD